MSAKRITEQKTQRNTQKDRSERASDNAPKRILARKIGLSRFALAIEQVWPRIWPAIAVVCVFILASLAGLWDQVPLWLHKLLLAGFALALLACLMLPLQKIWPARSAALRRLEVKSGLPHRPASSYEDQLFSVNTSPAASREQGQIWKAHRQRLAAQFKALKAGWPQPRVDRYDPYALRAFLVLAVIVAVIIKGPGSLSQLKGAFLLAGTYNSAALRLDAWVTPPLYTAKAPLLLADGVNPSSQEGQEFRAIKVPENSVLIIRLNGSRKGQYLAQLKDDQTGELTPLLNLRAQKQADNTNDAANTKKADLKSKVKTGDKLGLTQIAHNLSAPTKTQSRTDLQVDEYRLTLKQQNQIVITERGRVISGWRFNLIKDHKPRISFSEPPQRTPRRALRFSYRAEDDYGIVNAHAEIKLAPEKRPLNKKDKLLKDKKSQDKTSQDKTSGPSAKAKAKNSTGDDLDRPIGEPPQWALSLPRNNSKSIKGRGFKDLTSHPWAGLDVLMTLHARDQAGQKAQTLPIRFKLPARNFTKPLAKAVIEQRKILIRKPRDRKKVLRALAALTIAPEKYFDDKMVYLGMRRAFWRLRRNDNRAGIINVADLLWEIALRIEDGDLSDVERQLRQAQEKLSQALKNNAPENELKKAIEELRQAISKYLQALAKKNQNNPAMAMPDMKSLNQMISPKDLNQMLKNLEDLARSGAKDMAQQMLNRLRDMLEGLQAGTAQRNGPAQRMMEMMNQLGDLVKKQQKLLDDTFNRQQGRSPQQGQRQGQAQQGPGKQGRGLRGQQGKGQQGRGLRGQQGRGQAQGPGQGPGSQRSQNGNQQGNQPGDRLSQLQQRQQALRDTLDKMLEQFRALGAKPPKQLEGAGKAMGEAEKALGVPDLNRATDQQTLALDMLRKGAQSMANQILQNLMAQRGRPQSRDPLGRPRRDEQGGLLGSTVKIPEEIDIQRAREILEELRSRFSEQTRPPVELEYLERLLRQF